MFYPLAPSFAQRLLGTLQLIRSFLLLEDDYDVDWEVDGDEPAVSPYSDSRGSSVSEHPHRTALRSRLAARRPGMAAPREQVCLSPVPPRAGRTSAQRGSRITTGSGRFVSDR